MCVSKNKEHNFQSIDKVVQISYTEHCYDSKYLPNYQDSKSNN